MVRSQYAIKRMEPSRNYATLLTSAATGCFGEFRNFVSCQKVNTSYQGLIPFYICDITNMNRRIRMRVLSRIIA